MTLGENGLHGDNFSSMPGTSPITTYEFGGFDSMHDASLDLLPQGTSVPVIPLADGRVLATWPMCHLLVIDHGNGIWVEYLHINVAVAPDEWVTRNTVVGTTTAQISQGGRCGETYDGGAPVDHVHFAFLQGSDTNGKGTFQSMVGKILCGYEVKRDANGTLVNVKDHTKIVQGRPFPIPAACPTGGPSSTSNPNSPAGTVKEYPLSTSSDGPTSIVNGPDGNLWFAQKGAIGRITPSGAIRAFPLPTPDIEVGVLIAAPDGNLWFTVRHAIGRITPAGAITEFPLPASALGPGDMITGPDGNLWFVEADSPTGQDTTPYAISRINSAGAITEFSVTPNSRPATLVVGPDGNIWFTEYSDDQIGRITPLGSVTEFPVPYVNPYDIVVGPDGNLWFSYESDNHIARITLSGTISEFALPASIYSTGSLIASPDGAIWFAASDANGKASAIGKIAPTGAIAEFPLPTKNSALSPVLPTIVVGPDDNLWFTEFGTNQIDRITPSGSITAFPIPTTQSGLLDITVGSDNNLWFTEYNAGRIGRITP